MKTTILFSAFIAISITGFAQQTAGSSADVAASAMATVQTNIPEKAVIKSKEKAENVYSASRKTVATTTAKAGNTLNHINTGAEANLASQSSVEAGTGTAAPDVSVRSNINVKSSQQVKGAQVVNAAKAVQSGAAGMSTHAVAKVSAVKNTVKPRPVNARIHTSSISAVRIR